MTRSSDGIELTLFSKTQLLSLKSAEDFAALNAALMEEIKPRGISSDFTSTTLLLSFGRF